MELSELQVYKSFVDNTLAEITNDFKSKIDSLPLDKKNKQYISEKVKEFFDSPNVFKFFKDSMQMVERLEPDDKLTASDYHKEKVIEILLKDLSTHVTNILNIKNINEQFIKETLKKIKQNPPRPSSQDRSYDQVVKGDIKISEVKNNNKYSHKIKFNKIGNFLLYQTWDPTGIVQNTHLPRDPSNKNHPREFHDAKAYIKANPDKVVTVDYPINDDRDVKLITGKEWVLSFNSVINYSPTAVMQIGYKNNVFLLKKAKINKNDEVVFYISTKEILVNNNNNNSEQMKNLKKIPLGKHKNVRFDIDYGNSITGNVCNGNSEFLTKETKGTSTCYCPAGSYITTMAANFIGFCFPDCDSGYGNTAGVCYAICDTGYYNWMGVCYENCGPGYYEDGFECSEACTGDTWSFGVDCWKHTSWWPHWPYIVYMKNIQPAAGAYTPGSYVPGPSFEWGSSEGYFCNTDAERWDPNSGSEASSEHEYQTDCEQSGEGACWNASNNSNHCCFSTGESSCCPPGSSC
jgi:hypothetical protein